MAWEAVQSFLDVCVVPVEDPTVTLVVRKGGAPAPSERLRAFATGSLGGPRLQDRTRSEWRVRPEAVDAVLAALEDAGGDAVAEHGHPLASLVWDAEVRLRDPCTGEPQQGVSPETFARFPVDGYGRVLGGSGVRASIGTTASSISLWLSLPADDRLPGAARHLQRHLPVRLSTKHWRRWRPTRDGTSYRSTKIPSPLAG
ncbi:hypothetical protein [Cellulosimicrobium cellulans]|uniref:hypothetical protein n=1 Tax=Cellulosimicrobium cellulans TaxID=1710 RepID=UPI0027DAFDD7|nr:hypothetical protein [Cellulosimicrobium cellulans]